MTTFRSPQRIRVLLSLQAPDGTTRFVDQLVARASGDIEYKYWSWGNALFAKYDIFHVHWPEYLVRSPRKPVRAVKRCLSLIFLVRLTMGRARIVRTVHNLVPHSGGSRFESWFEGRLEEATAHWIVLNAHTTTPSLAATTLIPHAEYGALYPRLPSGEPKPGRLLFFGRIDAYKGITGLVDVFRRTPESGLQLRIVGRPESAGWQNYIEDACRADPRLTAVLGFVDDHILAAEILASEAVVLPYQELHNSGVLLLALSLGRVCVVPRTSTTEALNNEIGPGWLKFFGAQLEGADLLEAIAMSRAQRGRHPEFHNRTLEDVGRGHRLVYKALAGESGDRL